MSCQPLGAAQAAQGTAPASPNNPIRVYYVKCRFEFYNLNKFELLTEMVRSTCSVEMPAVGGQPRCAGVRFNNRAPAHGRRREALAQPLYINARPMPTSAALPDTAPNREDP